MDVNLQCILEESCLPLELDNAGGAQTLLTCSKAELTKRMISSRHQKMLRQKQAQLALQKQHEDVSRSWKVIAQQDIALPSKKIPQKVLNRELLASFLVEGAQQREELVKSSNGNQALGRLAQDPINDQASHPARDEVMQTEQLAAQKPNIGIISSNVSQLTLLGNSSAVPDAMLTSNSHSYQLGDSTPKSAGSLSRMRSVPGNMRFHCPSPCRNFKLWDSLKRPRVSARVSPLWQSTSEEASRSITVSPKGASSQLIVVSPKGASSKVVEISPKSCTMEGSVELVDNALSDCVLEEAAIDID